MVRSERFSARRCRSNERTRGLRLGSSMNRNGRQRKGCPSGIRPPEPVPNVKMTSVCAGHRLGGAPRRNRTGDPILTMEPPGTAVRTAIFAGRARPSEEKLSALSTHSYAFISDYSEWLVVVPLVADHSEIP